MKDEKYWKMNIWKQLFINRRQFLSIFSCLSVKLYRSVSSKYIFIYTYNYCKIKSVIFRSNLLAITILIFFFVVLKGTSLTQRHYLRLLLYLKNSITRQHAHCDRLSFLLLVRYLFEFLLEWLRRCQYAGSAISMLLEQTSSTWFDRELQIDIGKEPSRLRVRHCGIMGRRSCVGLFANSLVRLSLTSQNFIVNIQYRCEYTKINDTSDLRSSMQWNAWRSMLNMLICVVSGFIFHHERAFNILHNVLCYNTCLSGALLTRVNVSPLWLRKRWVELVNSMFSTFNIRRISAYARNPNNNCSLLACRIKFVTREVSACW